MKQAGKKEYAEDSIILPKTSGKGLMVGDIVDGGDHTWRDITAEPTVRGIGGNSPTWDQIGSGPFRAYNFAVNDECWFCYHIPHDIVPGAPVHFHAHWCADGADDASVKWQFTYAYSKGYAQSVFDMGTGTVVTAESAPASPTYSPYTHQITETSAVVIPGLTEPDGLIYAHIKRITNGGTNNTDGIFMLTADVHYKSSNIGTAGRTFADGFYD